jgi:hypothetical protein
MDPAAVKSDPFGQLNACSVALRDAVLAGDAGHAEALRQAMLLRALLDACRIATSSVTSHLESHGISVDIVYAMDQMRGRCRRIEQLLNCILTPAPVPEWLRLMASLVRTLAEQSGLRPLLASHYSLLARKVPERSAESGEHYITRSRDDYRAMLRRAAMASASSKNSTASSSAARRNSAATFFGVSPAHIDSTSAYTTDNSFLPNAPAIASAQIVFPVPGGPAKLKARPSPVECRSPSPHRPKINAWLCTCASAPSSMRRVAGGRITSLKLRTGAMVSTTGRALKRPKNDSTGGVGMRAYFA